MKRTESTSTAPASSKAQPEEFDLVILGGGTGSTVAAWTLAEGLIALFSSAASSHNVAETRAARTSAA